LLQPSEAPPAYFQPLWLCTFGDIKRTTPLRRHNTVKLFEK
jgi:hypothetical protein